LCMALLNRASNVIMRFLLITIIYVFNITFAQNIQYGKIYKSAIIFFENGQRIEVKNLEFLNNTTVTYDNAITNQQLSEISQIQAKKGTASKGGIICGGACGLFMIVSALGGVFSSYEYEEYNNETNQNETKTEPGLSAGEVIVSTAIFAGISYGIGWLSGYIFDYLEVIYANQKNEMGKKAYALKTTNIPSTGNPWHRENGIFVDDLLLKHDWELLEALKNYPDEVKPHPAAEFCPGLLPKNAKRIKENIEINGNYNGRSISYQFSNPNSPVWRSTGLYASAGEKIYVKVPKYIIKKGVKIQIGSHIDADHAYNMESIRRFPYITESWSIDQTKIEVTSAFGGLIYITIPDGVELGNFIVTIRGAGRAPRYIHGETTKDEWLSSVRKYPAPWAELESDMVILTIPSSAIRDLDDPGRVMDFWKGAMDAANYLAARKIHTRPERYVIDPNWDWGAHAGYPIMIAGPWSQYLIDIDNIGLNYWWGTFHELGHNFQLSEWTWNGWTEVSCNLWPTYILETIAGVKREETWDGGNLIPERRKKRIEEYIKNGPDFNGKLLKDPALGLEVLLLLQESFGWEYYKKINRKYLTLSKNQENKSNREKIQEYIIISSEIAKLNLVEYYSDWGFPIDPKTERTLERLPNWSQNPLNQYTGRKN